MQPFHAGDEPEKPKGKKVFHTHNCHAAKLITTGRISGREGYRECKFCKGMD